MQINRIANYNITPQVSVKKTNSYSRLSERENQNTSDLYFGSNKMPVKSFFKSAILAVGTMLSSCLGKDVNKIENSEFPKIISHAFSKDEYRPVLGVDSLKVGDTTFYNTKIPSDEVSMTYGTVYEYKNGVKILESVSFLSPDRKSITPNASAKNKIDKTRDLMKQRYNIINQKNGIFIRTISDAEKYDLATSEISNVTKLPVDKEHLQITSVEFFNSRMEPIDIRNAELYMNGEKIKLGQYR